MFVRLLLVTKNIADFLKHLTMFVTFLLIKKQFKKSLKDIQYCGCSISVGSSFSYDDSNN